MKFNSLDSRDEDKHYYTSFMEISRIFATQTAFSRQMEPFGGFHISEAMKWEGKGHYGFYLGHSTWILGNGVGGQGSTSI